MGKTLSIDIVESQYTVYASQVSMQFAAEGLCELISPLVL